MKYFVKLLPIFILLGILYLLGPVKDVPHLDTRISAISDSPVLLERRINLGEKSIKNLRPDNEARIVWADSSNKQKTPYSVVYLHGFSASQEEGNPIHRDFARRYGFNLYLPRLSGHGLTEKEAMLYVTPESMLESAKEAIAVGTQIGEKVIVMSTSTGGTLSLYLAGENRDISSLILYSPNIDLYDPASVILDKHWGLEVARLVMDGKYMIYPPDTLTDQYWTKKYRLEALVSLKSMISATMKEEVFEKVKQPVFLGYYYKNDDEQDKVVSVSAMLKMFDELGTPEDKKRKYAFSEAGEHCIANRYKSKDLEGVKRETFNFAEQVLNLKPIKTIDQINRVQVKYGKPESKILSNHL